MKLSFLKSTAFVWALSLAGAACGATAFSVTPYVQHPATNAMSVIWFAKGGSGEAATLFWWTSGGVVRRQTVTGSWAVALTNNVASGSDSAVHGTQYKYRHRITGLTAGTTYTVSGWLAHKVISNYTGSAEYTVRVRVRTDADDPGNSWSVLAEQDIRTVIPGTARTTRFSLTFTIPAAYSVAPITRRCVNPAFTA